MKKFILLALLVVGTFAVESVAYAQPEGSYTCAIVNGVKCRVDLDSLGNPIDTICPGGSTGTATFNSTGGIIPQVGPVNVTLLATSLTATAFDPTVGVITTGLNPTAPIPLTSINSNGGVAGPRFPLTVNIAFPATATISSRPGITYVSRTPLQFRTTTATSVNPFVNETLRLQNDVDYYQQGDPAQKTIFRLRAAGTFVTLGNGNQGGGGPSTPGDIH